MSVAGVLTLNDTPLRDKPGQFTMFSPSGNAMNDIYRKKGEEASLSRVWAGVHYRFDVESGEALGKQVGDAVVARMRADGARR